MNNLNRSFMSTLFPDRPKWRAISALLVVCTCATSFVFAENPDPNDPYFREPKSVAKTEPEMQPYTQWLRDAHVKFEMVPIPGGEFLMGSPPSEKHHEADEGPQHKVKIEPFWMGKYEVTWDEYDTWRLNLDIKERKRIGRNQNTVDKKAEAVTRPSKEFTDMAYGMGHHRFPAINMTQLAAKMYCAWLTEKTGQYYRLPTEAEWEYACRAGTTGAYSFGNDTQRLAEYGWFYDISDETYHKVGKKKPNPWGLHDMHGNVSEWCLDQYHKGFYKQFKPHVPAVFPYAVPKTLYSRVARGGSWIDDPEELRSSNRVPSSHEWKIQDPFAPQSMWYHTDSDFVGFRIIRPLRRPSKEEIQKLVLYPDIPDELRK